MDPSFASFFFFLLGGSSFSSAKEKRDFAILRIPYRFFDIPVTIQKEKQIALTKERESKRSRISFVTGAAGSLENNTCLQMIAKGDYPKAGFEFAYSKNFVTWYAGKYVFDYGKKESVSSPSLRG